MATAAFGLVVAASVAAAYFYGKWRERVQVRRWLGFLHTEMGWTNVSPRQLRAMISVGMHYDWEEN